MVTRPDNTEREILDVLIVGAGISGIDAAYRIREKNPDITYRIVDKRDRIGGTWDLFRYPGVRSDSDILTLSFPFRPWTGERMMAEGGEIRDYLTETAAETGIDKHIDFGVTVTAADFDTATDMWTVTTEETSTTTEESSATTQETSTTTYRARFLYLCTGYYRYDTAYRPEFVGAQDFPGTVVHPQFWPADLDHRGKRVVVIGSGATAITLVPALAPDAEHVTMLQRSPSYLLPTAWREPTSLALRRILPDRWTLPILRWRNTIVTTGIYLACRRFPNAARKVLRRIAVRSLPAGYDVDTHFNPRYRPWDERLCITPDGDFYAAISRGDADVVTDQIERFTPTGIRLASGRDIDADIIVTATGLDLVAFGGTRLSIDSVEVKPHDRFAYRGYMLDGVPNFAWSVGYTNASWTLRVDITSRAVADLIAYMRAKGFRRATPTTGNEVLPERLLWNLESGYIKRAAQTLPKASDRAPWVVRHNPILDAIDSRRHDVTESMDFTS
ncbi:NAD(P)/FAD-dependent oxidoreductase [Gordonia jinhuaensis]|uniref:Monooxygenase flavin-binding family protein n=1 Tax=Gordonia jinhuaensis TaxID=1517702 RepID=A0A916TC35_9ACTN|nr:NAD(P)/FAD-dependent oxidoreductase [Gordonia jinhuaensis]GGB38878.1 monooxygenase flavin-binding family protein [Gordonia jinhuaensis]